jgi:AraC family transcriptional regulator of arabinose operon
LVCTLGGRGRFGYPGGEIKVTPGDLTLLEPGVLHDYGVEEELHLWETVWAHFYPYPHWSDWLQWPEEAPGLMRLRPSEAQGFDEVTAQLFEAYRRSLGSDRHGKALAMNALEEALILCDRYNPRSPGLRWDRRVQQSVDYLCSHLSKRFSLDEMAASVGLSPSRIAHLFREQTGTTPLQFLEVQRMERARQLLEATSQTIEAVGRDVGYDDPFYFSKRFKAQAGVSPREYRKHFKMMNDEL